jgi:serine O-acetyltransferase
VLGPVTIGADSVIGAAAVVVRDAPPDSLLVGAPATARPRMGKGTGTVTDGVGPDPGILPEEWYFQI